MTKSSEPLGEEPLVACVVCEAIVPMNNAAQHWVATRGKPIKVWICRKCLHLRSQETIHKYVMKQEKQGLGRQKPEQQSR